MDSCFQYRCIIYAAGPDSRIDHVRRTYPVLGFRELAPLYSTFYKRLRSTSPTRASISRLTHHSSSRHSFDALLILAGCCLRRKYSFIAFLAIGMAFGSSIVYSTSVSNSIPRLFVSSGWNSPREHPPYPQTPPSRRPRPIPSNSSSAFSPTSSLGLRQRVE